MVYRVDLPSGWIAGTSLELALGQQSGPLWSEESAVCFSVPANGAVMVDAGLRLLSLANQLDHIGKRVTLEFCPEDTSTYDYLNRIGFFDGLRPNVAVRPDRPSLLGGIALPGRQQRPGRDRNAAPRLARQVAADPAGEGAGELDSAGSAA